MDYNLKDFDYLHEMNMWFGQFKEHAGFISCSYHIDMTQMTLEQMQTEKPVYLGVMASMKQLQPILDNPHLFDAAFLTAIHALAVQYDKLKIEESE